MGCHKAFVFLGVPGCVPPVDCSAGEQCGQDTQGDTWDPPEGDTCRQDTQGYTWDPQKGIRVGRMLRVTCGIPRMGFHSGTIFFGELVGI